MSRVARLDIEYHLGLEGTVHYLLHVAQGPLPYYVLVVLPYYTVLNMVYGVLFWRIYQLRFRREHPD